MQCRIRDEGMKALDSNREKCKGGKAGSRGVRLKRTPCCCTLFWEEMTTVGMRAKEVIEIGVYVLWTRKGGRYRKTGAIKWRMGSKHIQLAQHLQHCYHKKRARK